jgi:flagellar biosynthesis chaperone FliJ
MDFVFFFTSFYRRLSINLTEQFAAKLAHLLDLREKRHPAASSQIKKASYSLSDVVTYLESNLESLIDYRTWQRVGWRISTGFVESSINQ